MSIKDILALLIICTYQHVYVIYFNLTVKEIHIYYTLYRYSSWTKIKTIFWVVTVKSRYLQYPLSYSVYLSVRCNEHKKP